MKSLTSEEAVESEEIQESQPPPPKNILHVEEIKKVEAFLYQSKRKDKDKI